MSSEEGVILAVVIGIVVVIAWADRIARRNGPAPARREDRGDD